MLCMTSDSSRGLQIRKVFGEPEQAISAVSRTMNGIHHAKSAYTSCNSFEASRKSAEDTVQHKELLLIQPAMEQKKLCLTDNRICDSHSVTVVSL